MKNIGIILFALFIITSTNLHAEEDLATFVASNYDCATLTELQKAALMAKPNNMRSILQQQLMPSIQLKQPIMTADENAIDELVECGLSRADAQEIAINRAHCNHTRITSEAINEEQKRHAVKIIQSLNKTLCLLVNASKNAAYLHKLISDGLQENLIECIQLLIDHGANENIIQTALNNAGFRSIAMDEDFYS